MTENKNQDLIDDIRKLMKDSLDAQRSINRINLMIDERMKKLKK